MGRRKRVKGVMPVMWTRRQFLKAAGAATLWPSARTPKAATAAGAVVNDIQSQLNSTRVA